MAQQEWSFESRILRQISDSDGRRLAAETLAKLKASALDRTGEW